MEFLYAGYCSRFASMSKFEILVLVRGIITACVCIKLLNSYEKSFDSEELLTTAGEIENQVEASKGVRQDRM
jgi:hypothetical protein